MLLEGLGLYIWKIHRCESGDISTITRKALGAKLSHVLIKIANASEAYNVDLAGPLVDSLKSEGLTVYGWQTIHGKEPLDEARIAAHRVNLLGLDGFVLVPDQSYCEKYSQAKIYMRDLRSRTSSTPIGLSAHRFPLHFPDFPWMEFLDKSDFIMPRVFWTHSHHPASQLEECIRQYRNLSTLPLIPIGPLFEENGWRPSPQEIGLFLETAQNNGMVAFSFWLWDFAGSHEGRPLWDTLVNRVSDRGGHPRSVVELLFHYLTEGNVEKAVGMYREDARIATCEGVYQGHKEIFDYYTALIADARIRFKFELLDDQGGVKHIRWLSSYWDQDAIIHDARATLVIQQGLIAYHTTTQ